MTPLTQAELAAAAQRHTERTVQLRARGMAQRAFGRHEIYDWWLDRELLKKENQRQGEK